MADTPKLEAISGVNHKYNGPRPNGLEGAIVHFDAGRARPSKGPDNLQWGARACVAYAQSQGFAYQTIARDGTIFTPANLDWQKWGSHAGESRCPATDRTGVSRYYVGFEVNSPGVLYPTSDPDRFVPWYDAERNKAGAVVLDRQGRATPVAGALTYGADEVRRCAAHANIKAGVYLPYTQAQMDALVAIMHWLDARYPTFRLDRVFGHDEVAPTRKMDPGGSLGALPGPALTMAEFRAQLAGSAEEAAVGTPPEPPVDATHKVTASSLNVRAGPGTTAAIVGKLASGAQVTVLEAAGDWSRIAAGWVASRYLQRA